MRTFVLLVLGLAAVAAVPSKQERIIGGDTTTISQYPHMVALLVTMNWSTWWQNCGGTLINQRSVLTAAHCPSGNPVSTWRVRVGSTYANSGGVVHLLETYILHPQFNEGFPLNNDVAILRTAGVIEYVNNAVQPGTFAGPNYNVADNSVVWASGWGHTSPGGTLSETLRHVQVWIINQDICVSRYRELNIDVTPNMICSGWLDVGGRDQCQGDSGGPLYHNNVVVGVCSWGHSCAHERYPGVNVRVSQVSPWIQANA